MKKLTKLQIFAMHGEIILKTGGSFGLRDEGLLESALAAPFQTFDGQPAFPTIQQKAARLGFGIIKNHPFVDGNKRIGTHAMITMLDMNGITLAYTQQELYEIILRVAAGEADFEALLGWLLDHEA
jgi:death-on-curing protein